MFWGFPQFFSSFWALFTEANLGECQRYLEMEMKGRVSFAHISRSIRHLSYLLINSQQPLWGENESWFTGEQTETFYVLLENAVPMGCVLPLGVGVNSETVFNEWQRLCTEPTAKALAMKDLNVPGSLPSGSLVTIGQSLGTLFHRRRMEKRKLDFTYRWRGNSGPEKNLPLLLSL